MGWARNNKCKLYFTYLAFSKHESPEDTDSQIIIWLLKYMEPNTTSAANTYLGKCEPDHSPSDSSKIQSYQLWDLTGEGVGAWNYPCSGSAALQSLLYGLHFANCRQFLQTMAVYLLCSLLVLLRPKYIQFLIYYLRKYILLLVRKLLCLIPL